MKQSGRFVGIDMSKDSFDVCFLSQEALLEEGHFNNDVNNKKGIPIPFYFMFSIGKTKISHRQSGRESIDTTIPLPYRQKFQLLFSILLKNHPKTGKAFFNSIFSPNKHK